MIEKILLLLLRRGRSRSSRVESGVYAERSRRLRCAFPFDRKESGMPKAQPSLSHFVGQSRFSSKRLQNPAAPHDPNVSRAERDAAVSILMNCGNCGRSPLIPPLAHDRAEYLERFLRIARRGALNHAKMRRRDFSCRFIVSFLRRIPARGTGRLS